MFSRRLEIATVAASSLIVALVAAASVQYFAGGSQLQHAYRTSLLPPSRGVVYPVVQPAGFLALSPDGTRLAFVAATQDGPQMLWIRSLDTLGAQPLSGTEGASYPFWSPDSTSVAFFSGERLLRIEAGGGPVTMIAASAFAAGGTWNHNGTILFRGLPSNVLHRVPSFGGQPTPVSTLNISNGEAAHQFPVFLPDGDHFIFSAVGGAPASTAATSTGQVPRGVYAGSLNSPAREHLLDDAINVQYARGHLFFLQGTALFAQPFDVNSRELMRSAVQVADQIVTGGFAGRSGAFTVSENGVLAYQTGSVLSQLTWFDRQGFELGTVGEPGEIAALELSQDRTKALVALADPRTRTRDIWVYDDLSPGVPTRLTFTEAGRHQRYGPLTRNR